MGRYSCFNKQQVLADALDLFWERGFASTSLKQLEDVTGMHPGSLYYHFKNKEQLYLACLRHYIQWHLQPKIERYLIYTAGVEGLRRFFTSGYRHQADYAFRNSCFLVHASNELHLLPDESSVMVQEGLEMIRSGLLMYLKTEQEKNHLPILNQQIVVNELINLYLSIQLQARITPNQHRLDRQIKLCLNNLILP